MVVSSGGIADLSALQFDVVWSAGGASMGAVRIGPAGAALNLSLTGNFIPDSGSLGFFWFDSNLAANAVAAGAVLFEFDLDAKGSFVGKMPVGLLNVLAASSVETLVVGEVSMDVDFGGLAAVPPTVSLGVGDPPAGGWMAPAMVPLTATVDPRGNVVSKVQFLLGNEVVGESAAAPYGLNWSGVGAGTRSVVARVLYGSGQSVDSAPVSVTVQASSSVKVSLAVGSPPAGNWVAPATIPVSATLDVHGDTVSKVQFLANGEVVGEVTAAPYALTWNGVGAGTRSLVARAFLGSGKTVDSTGVDLTVSTAGVTRGVTLQVATEDGTPNRWIRVTGWGLSGIVGLEFELTWDGAKARRKSTRIGTGGTVLGLESGEWFSEATDRIKLLWNDGLIQGRTVPDGAVLFEVLLEPLSGGGKIPISVGPINAIDSNLDALDATGLGITVEFGGSVTPPAPTVALTVGSTPAGGWVAPATVPLTATVDPRGNVVSKVQFLADGQVVGEDAMAPYEWSWTGVTAETRTVVARVVYASNQTVDSAPVTLVVTLSKLMLVIDPVGIGQGLSLVVAAPQGVEIVVESATDLSNWSVSSRVPGRGPDVPVRISIIPDSVTTARFWRLRVP